MEKKSFSRFYIKKCWCSLTKIIFKHTDITESSELESNDLPKCPIVQTLNNPINIF